MHEVDYTKRISDRITELEDEDTTMETRVGDLEDGKADGTPGVKIYRALLLQSGTNAPVATVLENSLGGTLVWSYYDVGVYYVELTGAFPSGRTLVTVTPGETSFAYIAAIPVGVNQLWLETFTLNGLVYTNGLLTTGANIEILVYPA